MGRIIFITGGARSGKSSFVLKEASKIQGKKAFIATAEALDSEMKERIERHRRERGDEWDTYEEPLRIAETIEAVKDKYSVIVIDCLTMWVSNLMMEDGRWKMEDRFNEFIHCLNGLNSLNGLNGLNGLNSLNGLTLYIISNEIGMGIVPDNEMARLFRDFAGHLNQKVAEIADEVYFVISGIGMKIKG